MNKRIASSFFLLIGSLTLAGLGWWLQTRDLWAGAKGLVLLGGLLAAFFAVLLLTRIAKGNKPAPMN